MNIESAPIFKRNLFHFISISSTFSSLFYILFITAIFGIIGLKCADELNFSNNNGGTKIQRNANDMQTIFNRMVCENEKLILACNKENHVIKIEKAYYGRYSITPCNKNHLKYTKGCTSNNSLAIITQL
jgi:hypothetical protein